MNKLTCFVFALGFAALALGCRHKMEYNPGQVSAKNETGDGGLKAEVEWIKNKKDAVDVLLKLTNNYKEPVVITRSSVALAFNGTNGHKLTDHLPEQIGAGATSSGILVFKFDKGKEERGNVTITIDPIYVGSEKNKPAAPLKLEVGVQ